MVWMAALYLTASPKNGSSSPMCVFAVLHPQSATQAAVTRARLKDMAVILLKTDGFLLRHSAHRRTSRHGRRRRRRLDERPRRWRHAGVGAPVEQQVGFVRWPDPVGRHLECACPYRPQQPRRNDDDQLGFLVLEAG